MGICMQADSTPQGTSAFNSYSKPIIFRGELDTLILATWITLLIDCSCILLGNYVMTSGMCLKRPKFLGYYENYERRCPATQIRVSIPHFFLSRYLVRTIFDGVLNKV